MKHPVLTTLSLLLLMQGAPRADEAIDCAPALSYFDHSAHAPTWYQGSLTFRGDTAPFRLKLTGTAQGLAGWLDLPELVYAWEPVTVTGTKTSFRLELPFGIGWFELSGGQANQIVSRSLGGQVIELRLDAIEKPVFHCRPLDFQGHGVRLAGSLIMPDGPGPHPAVVLAHGAGPVGRHSWSYRSWADFHVRQGLAVLIYDKRGTGFSTGDTHDADLDVLAADLEAAVEILRRVPEIDDMHIGIRSHSQGGWLASLVAARNPAVAFLILGSPSAMDPLAQEVAHVEQELRAAEMSDAAIGEAMDYMRLYETTVRTGQGWAELKEAAVRASRQAWGEFVDQPYEQGHLDWYRANAGVDPVPHWRELRIPVLTLYGADDRIVPPAVHAPRLRAAFIDRPELLEAHIFEAANHRLEASMGADADGRWRWFGMADGVLDVQRDWLNHRALAASPPE